MENQFAVIANKKKNRLYIYLYDEDVGQNESLVDEIWNKAQQLDAGWGCIVNFPELDIPLTLEALEKAETVMSFLKQLGMGQLVRVLNENQSPYQEELKKRSMALGGYEGLEVRTLQNADAILDRIPD